MIVGIDIGGTKTHVRAESTGVTLLDRAVPTAEWQVDGRLDSAASVERLLALFGHLPGAEEAALAVGAHGLDSDAQAEAFQTALADARPGRTWTVNDVELLGPAAGFDEAIAVIAGTGSKIVGRRADGSPVTAGGYGYILNDPGSAPALVRDAVRSLFDAVDERETLDQLAHALFAHFDVDDIVGLSNALTVHPRITRWGAAAPLVFAAADAGSPRAAQVIDQAADELARSVELVHRHGAVGDHVVCAGGVITHQPRLLRAFRERLRARGLGHAVHLLAAPPVEGALAMARRLTEAADAVPFAPTTPSRRKP
ncbi:BadF/BadG/BcrA/BcrD ATPase family protein [Leifsonia sp. TF02-11]|uniref:BadF/BadG/BcrA/BcrD ATPase family protein n=1 Tax=Leifsonia sp. TF02-11 TaxID=2815212 RepID=UPI001AA18599|nr:BadF/BadG/BcrA/BcrD ATPase family protein [Leifsonia sp. TF02-11]MBO1737984.1 hypothetical protein [Leifsonia sp. TF02-11]